MEYKVEYIDEVHTYLINGIITKSVTQVLHLLFPNKYKNVDYEVLMNKAKYGTEIHNYIEELENGEKSRKHRLKTILNDIQLKSIDDYLNIKEENNIKVIKQEEIVNYKDLYAGRFDMIAEINGEICLADIKTTATLDKEYLSWQLTLYELAYGERFDKLYAIWLPKNKKGKLVEIERKNEKEVNKLLNLLINM